MYPGFFNCRPGGSVITYTPLLTGHELGRALGQRETIYSGLTSRPVDWMC